MNTKKLIIHLVLVCTSPLAMAHPGHKNGRAVTVTADIQPPVQSRVSVKVEGNFRIIEANGIPNHPTGKFPNAGNPNTITEQNYHYRVPARPQVADKPTPLIHQPFGIAVNGVLFDPDTAEYWQSDRSSPWNYGALSGRIGLGLDENHAHVQPNGAYHYHGIPTTLLKKLSKGEKKMILLGWAADGFFIYGPLAIENSKSLQSPLREMKSSYKIKTGPRPSGRDSPGGNYDGTFTLDYEYDAGSGDLDECNGRFGPTPEFPEGTFYYVLTEEHPFIPRFFKGGPDASFQRRGPPGGPGIPRSREPGKHDGPLSPQDR